MARRVVVTGAFSYIGAAVAAELLARGFQVHSLTNRRAPRESVISASPLRFDPEYLSRELAGSDAFVNTYWVRLPYGGQTFVTAVERSGMLLDAVAAADVRRLVHVSVSNACAGRNLGYYRGKSEVEDKVRSLPISHAIVRPTLVVGPADVLTSNIAWLLRHFPLFPVPGSRCRLQPITLRDTAWIVADLVERNDEVEVDAAGPEIMTFMEYVKLIAKACRLRRLIIPTPAWIALAGLRLIQPLLGDIVLTREELLGLQQELLVSHQSPHGSQSVGNWLIEHGERLGRRYVNDVNRHFGAGASDPVLTVTADRLEQWKR